ncbi:helix-turn-helix domain-containing protein [Lentibacillus cibarius]|uniref:helix-turn-helix domain-containing protein n=1 Tax=Lentibacillus cibarius TaxID=2583219 RepID=UPI00163DB120|nr:helix-turn-helix domain-containing protein [Lentibacillus cibarius]
MDIGERIRQLRMQKNLTQGDLVKNTFSITYLSRIENGQINPSQSFLKEMSKRLKVSMDDLLGENPIHREERVTLLFDKFFSSIMLSDEELSFLHINAKEIHSPDTLIKIYGTLLSYYLIHKNMNEAEKIFTLSVHMLPDPIEDVDTKSLMYYYNACGSYFHFIQLYHRSDDYFTKAVSLTDNRMTIDNARVFHNTSLAKQLVMGDQTLISYYTTKAYHISKSLDSSEMLARLFIIQGLQYYTNRNYEESLKKLNHAREMTNPTNLKVQASIDYNVGKAHRGLGHFEAAIESYKKSIELNNETNEIEGTVDAYKELALIYINKRLWKEANVYLSNALKLAKEFNLYYMMIELGYIEASVHKVRGNDMTYEKEMQKTIDKGMNYEQYTLVRHMARELGDYFYEWRAYKKAASFFKLALDNGVDLTYSE